MKIHKMLLVLKSSPKVGRFVFFELLEMFSKLVIKITLKVFSQS